MQLLNSQKNALFDIVSQSDLSPSMFDLTDPSPISHSTNVFYKNPTYKFSISENGGNGSMYILEYVPGRSVYKEFVGANDFETIKENFKYWLRFLTSEVTIDDKWSRFKSQYQSVNFVPTPNGSNDKFTAQEYIKLTSDIKLLKDKLKELEYFKEHFVYIEGQLDHLTNIAIDLGKFDWKNLFIGVIISIIIQLGVTQDNAKILWDLIKEVFSNYYLLN